MADAGPGPPKQQVAVVVLGDIGRSPRMQYHSRSLARKGVRVSLVGYRGERCIAEVQNNPLIRIESFEPPLSGRVGTWLKRTAYLLFAALKLLLLALQLFWTLMVKIPAPDVVLVQNPPALPALLCVWTVCAFRGARMIIDWHNLGYTMLPYSERHFIVRLAKLYEAVLGRQADASFCVSKAFASYLRSAFLINSSVLYDRPPSHFLRRGSTISPEDATEKEHNLWQRLGPELQYIYAKHAALVATDSGQNVETGRLAVNPFTEETLEGVRPCSNRPFLLVSSTSWTPDEDFGVLLDALVAVDGHLCADRREGDGVPSHVVAIITGKGPLRDAFLTRVRSLDLQRVSIESLWLATGDYPTLLAAADLGVCLHSSTSGLDLPMKVLDMFGSGLPVCAVNYACVGELVLDGFNGRLFHNAEGLVALLRELLPGHAVAGSKLALMAQHARNIGRWEETWEKSAWPVIQETGTRRAERQLLSGRTIFVAACAVFPALLMGIMIRLVKPRLLWWAVL